MNFYLSLTFEQFRTLLFYLGIIIIRYVSMYEINSVARNLKGSRI